MSTVTIEPTQAVQVTHRATATVDIIRVPARLNRKAALRTAKSTFAVQHGVNDATCTSRILEETR